MTQPPSSSNDISDDAALGTYRSDLPGPLGWVDTGIARAESFVLVAGVLLMALNTGNLPLFNGVHP